MSPDERTPLERAHGWLEQAGAWGSLTTEELLEMAVAGVKPGPQQAHAWTAAAAFALVSIADDVHAFTTAALEELREP